MVDHFLAMVMFAKLAETGSLEAAAAALDMPPAAVRQQIDFLERQLGMTLLDRSAPGVVLTTEGRRVAAAARAIAGVVDDS